jgi:carbamoyl-phosphate synthase large subunit
MVPLARRLTEMGFRLYATLGTSTELWNNGIRSEAIFRISKGRPNALDLIEDKGVGWIINTPSSGAAPSLDEVKMRARAVIRGIPITTTIDGMRAAVNGLEALRRTGRMEVCSLQEYHRHSPRVTLPKGGAP